MSSRKPLRKQKSLGHWVTGIHSCREVIKTRPQAVREILIKPEVNKGTELYEFMEFAKVHKVKVQAQASALDRLSSGHQGVAVRVDGFISFDMEELRAERVVCLALDSLQDPQNLGAILRTSWLMGVKVVFVPELRSTHLTPAVTKVACGATEHVAVEVVSNLYDHLRSLKDLGFFVMGLKGGVNSTPLWSLNLPDKLVWVVGSEGDGLRSSTEKACDDLVAIPQTIEDASYNASVAAALALMETRRQWKTHAK